METRDDDRKRDLLAAVDGGGSGLRLALLDCSGQTIGVGSGGPANLHAVGIEGAASRLKEAWFAAWRDCNHTPQPVAQLYVGLAGCGEQANADHLRAALATLAICHPTGIRVDHDMAAMHAGAFALGAGTVIMAGTGSFAFGRKGAREARAGGGGPFLDDLGSGHDLGRQALALALRTMDGRRSDLGESPLAADLIGKVDWEKARAGRLSRHAVAAFAPLLLEAVERGGDLAAKQIMEAGAAALCSMADAVVRTLELSDAPYALCGGLLGNSAAYGKLVEGLMAARHPRMRRIAPLGTALDGAVRLVLAQHRASRG